MHLTLRSSGGRRAKRLAIGALATAGILIPAGSALAATPVNACGTAITAPGDYELTQDLVCTSGGEYGVTIEASNVDFSLNGFSITAFIGVVLGSNGNATDIHVTGPGSLIGDDTGYGAWLEDASNSSVSGVSASGSYGGVIAYSAVGPQSGNAISANTLSGNHFGVYALGNGTEIAGNDCSGNTLGAASERTGILLGPDSDANDVHDNSCNSNGRNGIRALNGSNGNLIHDNTALNNGSTDAVDENPGCDSNVWTGNTFGSFTPACANNEPPVACTVTGTAGNDRLRGTSGDDVICGLGGDDVLDGRGGNDEVYGNEGNDTVIGKGGNDKLVGGAGTDLLLPGAGDDSVDGGNGTRDRVLFSDIKGGGVDVFLASGSVTGEAGSDVGSDTLSNIEQVFGSTFNDILVAQIPGVASTLKGGAGDDQLDVDDGDGLDTVVGNQGSDTCTISAGDKARECEALPAA
jgi:Ca2+-binding RTX toxin-like protein